MPALRELQSAFAAAVLAGESSDLLTRGIVSAGIPPERRLGVYRANVVLSLRRLLQGTFPASQRLLGQERFAGLADAYVRRTPPDRPQLLAYGAGFPGLLAATDDLIGDVARLEWAREEACHAADARPLDAAAIAAIPAEHYAGLRFTPHPSLRIVRSTGPVYALWAGEPADDEPQRALVVRPEMTVVTRPVSAADTTLIESLIGGSTLGDAAAAAFAVAPEFDLQAALAAHLTGGSFAACR